MSPRWVQGVVMGVLFAAWMTVFMGLQDGDWLRAVFGGGLAGLFFGPVMAVALGRMQGRLFGGLVDLPRDEQRTVAKATEHTVEGVKVGDIFVSTWGYDETHHDFYKVVALTAKRIKIQACHKVSTVIGSQQYSRTNGTVVKGAPVEIKKVVHYGSDNAWITLNTYSGARLWDGKQVTETAPGWGR